MKNEEFDDKAKEQIRAWKAIRRDIDGADAYSKAQFNLGDLYFEHGRFEEAINFFNNIERKDNPQLYARIKIDLGIMAKNRGSLSEAIEEWRKVNRTDDKEAYVRAQHYISDLLKQKGDLEGALASLRNIRHDDDVTIYTRAQLNIGQILHTMGDYEGAIKVLLNVKRADSAKVFANAQMNIGNILHMQGKTKEAVQFWSSISSTDDAELYANAQYNIGYEAYEDGDIEKALNLWGGIKRTDDPEVYAIANLNIGNTLIKIGKKDSAMLAWQSILYSDDPKIYAHAQFKLGYLSINEHDTNNAKKYFKTSESLYPFESYCYIKIIEFLDDSNTIDLGGGLLQLLSKVLNIVDILTLDFGKYKDEEKPFERKLAHYTGTSTANILLAKDSKKNLPSSFRLNTINNVNDPSEGQLLINILKGNNDISFKASKLNEDFHAFISCFTFNHDSLNQFRLYGKQDNKEASGMSLVFRKDFFQPKSFIGGLSFLSMSSASSAIPKVSSFNNKVQHTLSKTKSSATKEEKIKIDKKPIMRCVYLDPTSDYIHVAQRNRLTFFREFGKNTISKNGISISQAEYEWSLYEKYINGITQDFSKAFSDLKVIFGSIETKVNSMEGAIDNFNKEKVMLFIDQILLPLKYLIKHSAFREEEECRMVYVTSIDSSEVYMEYGSYLFVEYKPNVKYNLDKVYIAPVATQYHPYLAKLLSGTSVKIELSKNPYRQT